jgi:hypothetical protein
MATGVINELIVVNDIELVLVTNIGDFRDQARGISTVCE